MIDGIIYKRGHKLSNMGGNLIIEPLMSGFKIQLSRKSGHKYIRKRQYG
jgi:hypothetical protein